DDRVAPELIAERIRVGAEFVYVLRGKVGQVRIRALDPDGALRADAVLEVGVVDDQGLYGLGAGALVRLNLGAGAEGRYSVNAGDFELALRLDGLGTIDLGMQSVRGGSVLDLGERFFAEPAWIDLHVPEVPGLHGVVPVVAVDVDSGRKLQYEQVSPPDRVRLGPIQPGRIRIEFPYPAEELSSDVIVLTPGEVRTIP
ncbi:MAG: hypothetical protein AAFZ65_03515, partial [Planctomycetota bacterium]